MHLVMIGGSDAGISAALRARELDPSADVSMVVMVLVVAGVRPDTELAAAAGASLGVRVASAMQTGLPDVLAAGDCVVTHHRLLGETYLPLGPDPRPGHRPVRRAAAGPDRDRADGRVAARPFRPARPQCRCVCRAGSIICRCCAAPGRFRSR